MNINKKQQQETLKVKTHLLKHAPTKPSISTLSKKLKKLKTYIIIRPGFSISTERPQT